MANMSFWKYTITLAVLLLGSTFAGRLDTVARNKGYHPNAIRDHALRGRGVGEEAANSTRYLNANTEKYYVKSLPEVPQSFMTEMYSGLIPIVEGEPDRALFFVFQPRVGDPVDEVTIWLNGGPGCSSLEGFLQENGLIRWTWGQYAPTINDYSWVNLTNMLWVEQPVGTGFSIGKVNATNELDISSDFIKFFKNFETTFGIKNYKIYVTGESYAGRYVPYISNAMLEQEDKEYYDLSGALLYDPCIGAFDAQNDITILDFIEANNNVLQFNESFIADMTALDESCGWKEFRENYMHFPPNGTQPILKEPTGDCNLWSAAYDAAYGPSPCFNVYQIGLGSTCPLLSDPLGYPTDLQLVSTGEPIYFDRKDVKEAMHAPDIAWLECSAKSVFVGKGGGAESTSPGSGGPEGYGDTSPDPIQGVLPNVIEKTNRVLVANGQLDMEIITNATLLAIQNMTWNGVQGFQAAPSKEIVISLPDKQYSHIFKLSGLGGLDKHQGVMGKQHYERGLMFAETYLSGHMEPQFQPRSAYRHLQWVLGRIDEL